MFNERQPAHADRQFLIFLLILVIFGLSALTSASSPVGYDRFGDLFYFVKHQIFVGLLPGLICFLILSKLDYTLFSKFAWWFYGFCLLLLIAVFIPGVGLVLNGSRSWIGVAGFSFQPAELAKFGLIVITAALLSDPHRDLSDWKNGLVPVLAILSPLFLFILLQPDIGTLSILLVILFVMLYLAHIPKNFLAVMGAVGVLCFVALMLAAPYRVERLTTFLHPELDPKGVGYHVNQAFLAVGSGGFWGLGLGHSRQKFQYLPEVSADSIYAVIAEENGFLVASALVILILLIGWRGLKIAKKAPDEFGRLLVSGVIVWLVWQSFLNIGAMVGVLPLTGVPLPLISAGGSAMLVMLCALGVVANVSRSTN